MKERTTVRLARAWWLLTMGLLVLTVVLGILSSGEEPADWFSTAVLIGMTGFATVGALVASRHPRNPIGWLFSAIAFGVVLVGFRETYVVYALFTSPGSLPGATVVAWLGGWIPLLAITSIPFVFLLFPDGSPPSRRWKLSARCHTATCWPRSAPRAASRSTHCCRAGRRNAGAIWRWP